MSILPLIFNTGSMQPPRGFDCAAYIAAVERADLRWLNKNVGDNEDLTVMERRWLANQTSNGDDLLSVAVRCKSPALLDFLMLDGAQPYRVDVPGALSAALTTGNAKALRRLCQNPTEVEEEQAMLAIMLSAFAVQTFRHDLTSPLIQAGADQTVWVQSPERTPLHAALVAYRHLLQQEAAEDDERLANTLETIEDMMNAGARPQQGKGHGPTAHDLALSILRDYGDEGPHLVMQKYEHEEPAENVAETLIHSVMSSRPSAIKPGPA